MTVPVSATSAKDILDFLHVGITVPVVDLSGEDFALPDWDATTHPLPAALTLEQLTSGVVNGTGSFDKVMTSIRAHLKDQYEKGTITGDQYSRAYIELTTAALNTGLQFLLQKDRGYWEAVAARSLAHKAEIEAVTAGVNLEIAKHQLAAAEQQTKLLEAQHALTTMQLSSEDAKIRLTEEQILMVKEQKEAQRAQTLNTRTDGTTVVGVLGKQKDLYSQQITSYQRDSEAKVGKMFLDGWLTQKTIDEGLTAPTQLQNTAINNVLDKVRTNAGLT